MQIDAGVRASERRRPEPPGRRREDWLEGRCEWVTSRGWRQRVCESVSSRRCSVVLLCLVPIHHLSGISQGVMRNVHSCENKKDEGENGKSQLRQMRTEPTMLLCVMFCNFPGSDSCMSDYQNAARIPALESGSIFCHHYYILNDPHHRPKDCSYNPPQP
ncbi:hypothetical protein ROHU_007403 [Labeo rohita]|uniref:Uncharacterized protein n=1 Tax=Labeo rohita TaxID=84645 RepID=A0A498MQ39_LABRO|nr:hypothetical protein ROHU_007403 [Labeo rohita]